MTSGERSAIRTAVGAVLLAAAVRWVVDGPRSTTDPLAGRPDEAARLDSASQVHEADEAARSRPLEPGERLDANRAPAAELDRLPGVGPALARAWVAHREARGPFAGPGDLTAVPGIGEATAGRLAPFLQFSGGGPMLVRRETIGASTRGSAPASGTPTVDLNTTDSTGLLALPGVGPALAGRILERRRAGPFRRVDDLLEIRGIGPATLERLRGRVVVGRR